MLQKFGADALRLYVMFVAPPEKEVEWTDTGLEGSFRFLARVWRLVDHWAETVGGEGIGERRQLRDRSTPAEKALRRKTHDTIRRVTADIEQRQQLNTAVSAMMELVNELYAFSEQTVTGGPARRTDEDVEHAGQVERAGDDLRRPRGDRSAGPDAVAVCAAYGRGAVGDARPRRRAAGRGLAGVRRRRGQGRRDRDSGAGQRQGARPAHGAAPTRRSRSSSAGAGRSRRVQAHIAGKTVKKVVVAKGRLVSIVVVDSGEALDRRGSVLAVLALSASSGCGYALAGRGSFLPGYIRVVGIPPIENRSTFFHVEQILTEKVRAEFIGRGKYTVVPDAAGADARADRRDPRIIVQPVGFNEQQLASRYLFTVVMKVQFTDARTNDGAVVERRADVPRGIRAADARRPAARRRDASSIRSAARVRPHRHRRRAHRRHRHPRGLLSVPPLTATALRKQLACRRDRPRCYLLVGADDVEKAAVARRVRRARRGGPRPSTSSGSTAARRRSTR